MVGAIFDHPKGKAKGEKETSKVTSNHPNKKKNKQQREDSLMATVDRKCGRKPTKGTPNHFEKLLEGHA